MFKELTVSYKLTIQLYSSKAKNSERNNSPCKIWISLRPLKKEMKDVERQALKDSCFKNSIIQSHKSKRSSNHFTIILLMINWKNFTINLL